MTMTSKRTDIHRPSTIDPADYTYIGSYINNPPCDEEGNLLIPEEELVDYPQDHLDGASFRDILHPALNPGRAYPNELDRCDHCGAYLNYVAVYRHNPSNQTITTGHDCADNTMGMSNRRALDAKRQKNAMEAARANVQLEAARQKYLGETRTMFPQAFAIVNGYQGSNSFIADVATRLAKYGRMSKYDQTKVANAIVSSHNLDLERQQQKEAGEIKPCPEGKGVVIEGEVIKVDSKENDFGVRWVMTVKHEDGWAVWGTIPSGLDVDRGDRVRFVANIERSNKSETFGFYNRPRKAELLERAPEPEPEIEIVELVNNPEALKAVGRNILLMEKALDMFNVDDCDAWKGLVTHIKALQARWAELGGDPELVATPELDHI